MRGAGKWFIAVTALAASLVFLPRPADPLPNLPRIVVWAWERPENLTTLDPHNAGVAFLARTVFLRHGGVGVRPRQHPLQHAPGAALIAVVRVETGAQPLPAATEAAAAVAAAAKQPGIRALQIDFDAVESERAYYRDLLRAVRPAVPPSLPISITALASWCEGDRWLTGLPIAEAVPMLFRARATTDPERFREPLCASSAGVSTDEPLSNPPPHRRVYIFNPRPWSPETLRAAIQEVSRWQ